MSKEKEAAVRNELEDYQRAASSFKARALVLEKQRDDLVADSVAVEKKRIRLVKTIHDEINPKIDFLKRQLLRIEAEKNAAPVFSDETRVDLSEAA